MSDKHPEIECYECGRLKPRLIWNSRCATCVVRRLEVNLEENDNLRVQLADLQAECELLRAAIRRLCNIYVVDDYYDGQLREERLESAVNRTINAALETHQDNQQIRRCK